MPPDIILIDVFDLIRFFPPRCIYFIRHASHSVPRIFILSAQVREPLLRCNVETEHVRSEYIVLDQILPVYFTCN